MKGELTESPYRGFERVVKDVVYLEDEATQEDVCKAFVVNEDGSEVEFMALQGYGLDEYRGLNTDYVDRSIRSIKFQGMKVINDDGIANYYGLMYSKHRMNRLNTEKYKSLILNSS